MIVGMALTGMLTATLKKKAKGMYMVGQERFAGRCVEWGEAVNGAMKREIAIGAFDIMRIAKQNTPVNQGHLRRSIKVLLTRKGLTAKVGTSVRYANYIEFGTGPQAHPLPQPQFPFEFSVEGKKRLKKWGIKHGWADEDIFFLATYIGDEGLKPRLFLTKAFKSEKYKIMAKIRAVAHFAGLRVGFSTSL